MKSVAANLADPQFMGLEVLEGKSNYIVTAHDGRKVLISKVLVAQEEEKYMKDPSKFFWGTEEDAWVCKIHRRIDCRACWRA